MNKGHVDIEKHRTGNIVTGALGIDIKSTSSLGTIYCMYDQEW